MVGTSTSHIDALFNRLAVDKRATVIFENNSEIDAGALLDRSHAWITELRRQGLSAGDVCAIVGDFGRESVSLMLALMRLGAIAMPLSDSTIQLERLLAIAGARWVIQCQTDAGFLVETIAGLPQNDLIVQFQAIQHPGLVVFTSGSSGEPKGILHDFERVLGKFSIARRGWRTILFLTIDHFGGINTLLGCLAHGGIGVCLPSRTPDAVCSAIETVRAELLPTTPTFLKVLLASGCWKSYDLSSLQMITYGAEPMPQATLDRVTTIFPQAKLKQTYGLSELGVLHSKSLDDKSLWLRVGGEGFETRIVDGVLQIRSQSNMIGYLNAPSPIDCDGWMSTGDLIEQRNGFIRFLGRVSEIINVGGQKVFPGEIEDVLLGADGVADATVFAAPHPLLGQAVCARVSLMPQEPPEMAVNRLRQYCRERLAKFKVPMRFEIVDANAQSTDRNKKFRPATKKV